MNYRKLDCYTADYVMRFIRTVRFVSPRAKFNLYNAVYYLQPYCTVKQYTTKFAKSFT